MFGIFGNIGKHLYMTAPYTSYPHYIVQDEGEPLFTQAELQQLKVVLAECVESEENTRKESVECVREIYKDRTYPYFHEDIYNELKIQRSCKKRIKLLANLLSKVKKELT